MSCGSCDFGDRDLTVFGVLVDDRLNRAPDVQRVLTDYGSSILFRTGMPYPTKEQGLITFVMEADDKTREEIARKLEALGCVCVKSMVLR
ncbi:MAG TPA: hypothetical protein GX507_04045 [Clostridia bacterium]|nr:hypothetical protein [Clostridia bacterium]